MRVLSIYSNCSLGGMTSVYRSRAMREPGTQFDYIFSHDRGGRAGYTELPNSTVRVVAPERLPIYVNWVLGHARYREVRITANPGLVQNLSAPLSTSVVYEFHSPEPETLKNELTSLPVEKIDEVWAPSAWEADLILSVLPCGKRLPIRVVSNPVDTDTFRLEGDSMPIERGGKIPVSWIGRLENTQKNYLDYLRTLSILPSKFYGMVLFSLEHRPDRLENFLGDAAMLGVADRLKIYSNLPQERVAAFHRGVRDAGGVFYSSSISESFGYAVYEASLCGCPVVSFDVGPMKSNPISNVEFVPVGDLGAAQSAILAATTKERGIGNAKT